ncbi:helix-turn-helix domain-containing protein [Mycolicibacterium llatzerense]|uniref:helix-turn-helix domain-containing protein n=1 Tax=Mycolicibacterium llatzerense TaxID=280871 RepID=UPI0021B6D788|nr:helix-turn-helix transcriptional regulator [Mycolicibacterium llatzerense]MCT7373006.1 hypothetical protein [Mycolicibacterium llatzerense]
MNREAAGAALRALRESRDMSMKDLHAASGVSMMGLSYMERGIRKSRKDTISKVEEALGLPQGTYQRLLFSDDPDAELEKVVAMSRAPVSPVQGHTTTNGVVVGRRSATTALLGFAGANVETLTTLVERIPPAAAADFETVIASVIDRCLETEALTVDSWRMAVGAQSPDAKHLMDHLHTIEKIRRELVARLAARNLAARLDVACHASPIPDAVIAQMLGATAEDVWVWRNQGVIPGDAIDAVQAFVAYVDKPAKPGHTASKPSTN